MTTVRTIAQLVGAGHADLAERLVGVLAAPSNTPLTLREKKTLEAANVWLMDIILDAGSDSFLPREVKKVADLNRKLQPREARVLIKYFNANAPGSFSETVQSGVVKYPPHMYETIRAWIMRVYGSWVAEKTRTKIVRATSNMTFIKLDPTISEESKKRQLKQSEAHIENLRKVEHAALKLTGNRKLKKLVKRTQKTFKVDLRGLGQNYPTDRMTELTDKFPVVLNMESAGGRSTRGYWEPTPAVSRKIVFFIAHDYLQDIYKTWTLQHYVDKLDKTLKHELQHMVQTLIEDTLDEEAAITLRKKARKSLKDIPDKDRYWLEPDEFHTWILNSKQDLLEEVKVTRPEFWERGSTPLATRDVRPTRKEFDRFVGNPKPVKGHKVEGIEDAELEALGTATFFKTLHKYDRERWKLAMREFYKLMQPLMDK